MPYQTEPSANVALGGLLQGMLSRSKVLSEHTQAIAGHAGLAPIDCHLPFQYSDVAPGYCGD